MGRVLPAEFAERLHCINCASPRLVELSRGKFADQPLSAFIEADPWGESPVPHLKNAEWILVRCTDCEQVFHKRILTEDWNEKKYSLWMSIDAISAFEARLATGGGPFPSERKALRAREQVSHILRIEKHTRPIRDQGEPVRLLDFGCGSGEFLLFCRQFGVFEAYGVDRAAPRRDNALVRILPSLDDLKPGSSFHAIALFEVLEHLDDPAQVLRQLSERLVPNGVLVVETPDCTGVTGIQSRQDYLKIHPLEHINAFTHKTLKSMVERRGFACIRKGIAHVTAERMRIVKAEAKHLLYREDASTRLYFRKN